MNCSFIIVRAEKIIKSQVTATTRDNVIPLYKNIHVIFDENESYMILPSKND